MTHRNKQLFSRLGFLAGLGFAIILIFWLGQGLSKNNNVSDIDGNYEKGTAYLTEYGDFQCPACGLYYPLVKQLKEDFGDSLVVDFKHFPLRAIHKNADLASRAAEAALNQGKFWEMHDLLFENQKEWSNSDQAESLFAAYAVSLGLDQDKFFTDLDSSEAIDKVNSDYKGGISLGVTGTPTFFLNGKKITNPRNYEEFKQLIREAIEQ